MSGEVLILLTFMIARLDPVYFTEAVKIRDGELCRIHTYDGTVAGMQRVDVVETATSELVCFQPEMSKL